MSKIAVTILTIIIAASASGCAKKGGDNMSGSPEQKTTLKTAEQPALSSVEGAAPSSARPEPRGRAEGPATSSARPEPRRRAEGPVQSDKYEKATFAGGCFWGVEASFRAVEGVVATSVGYTGGQLDNPTYKAVCTDKTGHAEAVEVTYDPNIVSYQKLLDVFWRIHDPTTPNRQGPDVGTQYRSAIFFHTPQQQVLARASVQKLEQAGKFDKPIVTQIVPAQKFYKAEEHHQRYLEKQGKTSCSATIH